MLKLDLPRLDREGRLSLTATVPADDPLWADSGLSFATPVSVQLDAHEAGSGEIVVRGRVRGTLRDECRRCLEEVRTPVDLELTLVYAPADELAEEGGNEVELRRVSPNAVELDVGEAIREELILATDRFKVCRPDCKGLCPVCGVNLNETTCDCRLSEPDPRWDALRALKNE